MFQSALSGKNLSGRFSGHMKPDTYSFSILSAWFRKQKNGLTVAAADNDPNLRLLLHVFSTQHLLA